MNMLRLPSLFKSAKPKSFNYRPVYWDEKKERMRTGRGERKTTQLSFRQSHRPEYATQVSRANRRLIVIIFALLLIGYLILKI